MKRSVISIVLLCPVFIALMAFSVGNISEMKAYSLQNSKRYFGVCGCGWISSEFTKEFDATQVSYSHKMGNSNKKGCSGSYHVVEYDSKNKKRYVQECSKCGWESPLTTNSNHAHNMGIHHYSYAKHNCTYCVKTVER